jgi:hypothetical protein
MRRYAAKTDKTQAEIVAGLRAAGYHVTVLGLPVDLLVRHPGWASAAFVLMESKTPDKKGRVVVRKDRKEQADFCLAHGVPYVTSAQNALDWLRGACL